ncbi:MAG: hypothetical protein HY924_00495 [Elusimicrobia bacterium]|nr:hypothetical protein [Elusimicrobiota bacterium]
MKTQIALGVLAAVALAAGAYYGSRRTASQAAMAVSTMSMAMDQTAGWPKVPRMTASLMIEKYGPPEKVSEGRIEWGRRWPWKRIVVTDHPYSPLEQAVDYIVPPERVAAFSRFPHGVTVDAAMAELSARSDREELNRLALNLADDIATGKKTPEEAGRFHLKTVKTLSAGKSSPYTERLRFEAPDLRLDFASFPGP